MYFVAVKPKTDEINDTSVVLVQNDNEDDSDYEEKESEGSEMEEEEENDTNKASHDTKSSNTGWADAMQKILKTNKPKRKKTLVLAKAKKLCDIKVKEKEEEEDVSFEIDGIKEEIKTEPEEAIDKTNITVNTIPTKSRRITKMSGIRVKPSITDREHERMLQKIATK